MAIMADKWFNSGASALVYRFITVILFSMLLAVWLWDILTGRKPEME